jgi:hypothetical protein
VRSLPDRCAQEGDPFYEDSLFPSKALRRESNPWVLTKEEGMSDDRTKADKAWEARQEAARYRIFNAATNAAEATDEADDEKYFAVLDQAGNAAEAAAAEITGYKTYADLLEALDTRRKQS